MFGSRHKLGLLVEPRTVQPARGRSARRVQVLVAQLAAALSIALLALPSVAAAAGHRHRAHLSVRSSPASVSVRPGHAVRSRLHVSLRNGSARSVSFRVSGLPRGVHATFRPKAVKPGHIATLIVTTAASTPLGSYRLRVLAVSLPVRRHHRGRLLAGLAAAGSTGHRLGVRRSITLPVRVVDHASPADESGGPGSWPVQNHVETWSYDDGCNGGVGATPDLVHAWLTYAESNCGAGDTRALTDCDQAGTRYCTPIQYMDANMIYKSGSVPIAADAQENWWVHQPGQTDEAHRLTFNTGWGTGYLLDQGNPAVRSWFHNYVRTDYNSFDGLMMDDTGGSQGEQFYGSGHSSSRELPTNGTVLSEHRDMADAMTHDSGSRFMQIDNGLSVNPWLTPEFPLLNNGGVTGLIAEGDPISNGSITGYYSTLLDDMSYIDHTPSDFLVLLSYDQNGSSRARRIQAATVLLGYKPGHIVSWSDLDQSNQDLQVWPEEGIYPTDPVQTMATPSGSGCLSGNGNVCSTGGHNDVQVAPGVYRREYHDCYDQGTSFGDCAVIVNDTGNPVTIQSSWLTLDYSHQITMQGGDVQSGGTINTTGASFTPGSTTVPADDATLLSS